MTNKAVQNLPHDQLVNAYWVVPGRLLAGPYPSAPDPINAQKQVAALLDLGVDYIVDLTEPGEYGLRNYWPLLLEASKDQGGTIVRRNWSIPDMSVPTGEQMRATLDDIDAEVDTRIDAVVKFADESEPAKAEVMFSTAVAPEAPGVIHGDA